MRDTVLEQYLAKMGFLRDDYIQLCFRKRDSIHDESERKKHHRTGV